MKLTTAMERTALALAEKFAVDLTQRGASLGLELDGVRVLHIERATPRLVLVTLGKVKGDTVTKEQLFGFSTTYGPWLLSEIDEPLEDGGPFEATTFALLDPRGWRLSARLAQQIEREDWIERATISEKGMPV